MEIDVNRLHVGDIVRHFKGGLYRIIATGMHTETGEDLVIYQSLKDQRVWARPYKMFMGKVDKEKYPDATQEYRLELVEKKDDSYAFYSENLNTLISTIDDERLVSELNNRVRDGRIQAYPTIETNQRGYNKIWRLETDEKSN